MLEYVWLAGLVVGSFIRKWYTWKYKIKPNPFNKENALDYLLMGLSSLGLFILPLAYIFTDWLDAFDYHLAPGLSLPLGGLGALIFAFALWLLWRSHADLGRQWTLNLETREKHRLVTQGVFKRIRHPMYAAHFAWGLAQIFLLQNWVAGFSMLVLMLPLYLYRAPKEEAMMVKEFGQEYKDYMEKTGRILPKL